MWKRRFRCGKEGFNLKNDLKHALFPLMCVGTDLHLMVIVTEILRELVPTCCR